MNSAADLPVGIAVLVGVCLVGGALLTLLGAIGLARLRDFYQRVHAPTLGTSYGTFLMLAGSMIYFSATRGGLVLHEILIGAFLTLTTPVSLMLVVRAALHRDQEEGAPGIPARLAPKSERLD